MSISAVSRRDFLKHSMAATGAAALAGQSLLHAAEERARRRPNVVLIVTDDQKLEHFGFLRKKALTPHMDRLAGEGMLFTRAYTSTSVCTPSRFSCLTGRYASRCSAPSFLRSYTKERQTNVQWNTLLDHEKFTLPKAMKAAGYVTGMVGKWHNGGPQAWGRIRSKIKPADDPADPRVAKTLAEAQEAIHAYIRDQGFGYAAAINMGNFGSYPIRTMRCHNQEWITKGALDFIDQHKDKPFFLYMATSLMHGPSPTQSLKADPRITHGGLLANPVAGVQPSRQDVLERTRKAGVPDPLAGATWLDDGIGAVMKRIAEHGLDDDTLIIFFDDQGMEQGKGSCYEGGVRTPMFVRWRGRIRPGKMPALVQGIDIAPTVFDACGIEPPKGMAMDGTSLMPLLRGETKTVRDSLCFEIGYTRAVCTQQWKYLAFRIPPSRRLTLEQRKAMIERYAANKLKHEDRVITNKPEDPLSHLGYPGGQNTEQGGPMRRYRKVYHDPDQLFDLEADPGEQHNLATDPQYRPVLERMKAELKKHLARMPGTFAEFKTR
ncbi:MAG: sulfatase-like hydrolase/transferase [Candidatus Brocadiae bacterium]|nr:sulfatase-like hydrolase/transferase [Candidatus Brocadiia bacterium]